MCFLQRPFCRIIDRNCSKKVGVFWFQLNNFIASQGIFGDPSRRVHKGQPLQFRLGNCFWAMNQRMFSLLDSGACNIEIACQIFRTFVLNRVISPLDIQRKGQRKENIKSEIMNCFDFEIEAHNQFVKILLTLKWIPNCKVRVCRYICSQYFVIVISVLSVNLLVAESFAIL